MDLITFCNQLSSLTEDVSDEIYSKVKIRSYQKGEYISRNHEVCKNLFFIDEGLVKLGFTENGKEFIMSFFAEGSLFTLLDSYLTQQPSSYEIICLEQTAFSSIRREEMELLCKKHHSVETVFRKLVSMAVLNMMKRISEMLEENGTQRYKNFCKRK